MTPEQIPAELVEIVDRAAGRPHAADGQVLRTLALVLTRYEEMREAGLLVKPARSG